MPRESVGRSQFFTEHAPLWSTPIRGSGGRSDNAIQFIETYCRVVKDSVGGKVGTPVKLRQWQKDLIRGLLAIDEDKLLVHRRGLVGMPRKNGKSTLLSSLALWGLFCGPEGGEVYSLAGDREQARITFDAARRMIELNPDLANRATVYRNAIEYPQTGSVWRVVSSDAPLKEGLSPSFCLVDEVHVISQELWDVMSLAAGSRHEPLMVGITTAGVMTDRLGNPSLCHRLFEYGQRVIRGDIDDPSFYFCWWGVPDKADHTDPDVWAAANPGYGDIVASADFKSAVLSTPENEFRTKRLNQWVTSTEAWLPTGAWDALDELDGPDDGATVVLGFDGSYTDDSTALIGCTVAEVPHLFVVEVWESAGKPPGWTVPRESVDAAVDAAMRRWDVVEFAADPPKWESEMERWEERYGEVVVRFDTFSRARMAPACNRFYAAVTERNLTRDGSEVLARHLGNAVTKQTPQGTVIVKDAKSSPRKIDAAVAAVIAHDRAVWHVTNRPQPSSVVFAFT